MAQFDVPLPHADLDQLVAAAQALDLVPLPYTADMLRHRDFYAARAKGRELEAKWRRMVDVEFARFYAWPDYTEWATWKRGVLRFVAGLLDSASTLDIGLWLFLCFLAALAGAAQVRRPRLVGVGIGMGGVTVLFAVSGWYPRTWFGALAGFGYLCVGAATGLWAGGMARGRRRPRLVACICAITGGAALFLWGVPAARGAWESLWLIGLQYRTSFSISAGGIGYWEIGIGALLMLAGVAGIALLRLRRGRTPQEEPSGTSSKGGGDAAGA